MANEPIEQTACFTCDIFGAYWDKAETYSRNLTVSMNDFMAEVMTGVVGIYFLIVIMRGMLNNADIYDVFKKMLICMIILSVAWANSSNNITISFLQVVIQGITGLSVIAFDLTTNGGGIGGDSFTDLFIQCDYWHFHCIFI